MDDLRPQDPTERLVTPAEREQAVELCSDAFARDVLPVEEYERRLSAIYRASTVQQLEVLTRDLPAVAGRALPQQAGQTGPLPAARTGPPDARQLLPPLIDTFFGNVERRGYVVVPKRLDVRAMLGNIVLDFRDAHFGEGVTEIVVNAFLGNVEITLPDDVAIDNHGSALLASFTCAAGAPRSSRTVLIKGLALLGNVDVSAARRQLAP